MYQVKKLTQDAFWVGGSDRRLALFENVFPIPRGISYNSYLVLDEKTVLLDTVDKAVSGVFFENLEHLLAGRPLDYVIVNHMEPDHCATLGEVARRWPEAKLVGSARTLTMIGQFFSFDAASRFLTAKEGDTLCTGRHTFTFVMAPMVHWPEVMVTYDAADKALYSADAFGTFGALGGNLFADELDFAADWLPDARRYYANIVGKYGCQVQTLLAKADKLDIALLCPLHGPVWRKNIGWYVEKYRRWASYTPEETGVMIAYASVYGDTENAASILAARLGDLGVRNVAMYDVSAAHPSEIVAAAFRFSHLVFAATTYNAGIFCNMETALRDIAAHGLRGRTVALVENGSWAPASGRLMRELVSSMKDMTILEPTVSLRSSVKEAQRAALEALADAVYASMPKPPVRVHDRDVEPDALFRLSYGLFVLTAKDGGRDNGCIINTAMEVTDQPQRIAISVNKSDLTHDMIRKSGVFNLSVLTVDAPFSVFRHFGFQSGRDTDKFAGCESDCRSKNGLRYIPKYTNAFLSGKVVGEEDLGTHTVFTAEVTEAAVLSSVPSITYQYYQDNTKPKPAPAAEHKKGFVCRVCGYVYEGDTLPPDFVCPICRHGADAFDPLP